MSRAISESLSLLSETLGNCKTNLKEKEVADVDNIKISDVDEKIAEIQSGGSSGFKYLEYVKFWPNGEEYAPDNYETFKESTMTNTYDAKSFKFKTKDNNNLRLIISIDRQNSDNANNYQITPQPSGIRLSANTEYELKFTGSSSGSVYFSVMVYDSTVIGDYSSNSDSVDYYALMIPPM